MMIEPIIHMGAAVTSESTPVFRKIKAPTNVTCLSSRTKGIENLFGGVSPLTKGKRAILVQNYKCFHGFRYGQRYLNPFAVYSARGDGPLIPHERRGLMDSLNHIQTAARVFIVSLFWISLFFGASVWGGNNSGSHDKKDS